MPQNPSVVFNESSKRSEFVDKLSCVVSVFFAQQMWGNFCYLQFTNVKKSDFFQFFHILYVTCAMVPLCTMCVQFYTVKICFMQFCCKLGLIKISYMYLVMTGSKLD